MISVVDARRNARERRAPMFVITESVSLRWRPEEVFPALSDPQTQLEWDAETLRSVEKLTPGPLAEGARYRGRFKGYGTVEYEFVEYEPNRRFAHRAAIPMGRMHHLFELEPDPQGTRLSQTGELTPNLFGRLMWPVASRMLRKRFRTIGAEIGDFLARKVA